ncbi:MAG: methyltransferase domain-containing protein [Phycisphaerales bacterium]|nr:methyltransferase domain-containing protein [Phycisphaerales bacterium]
MTPPVLTHQETIRLDLPDSAAIVDAFNAIYEEAAGDPARIPWAHGKPNPTLLRWLDEHGCAVIRPGARVAVVGCGLGDDVALLTERGYEATGFDAAPCAIETARARHPDLRRALLVADLFDLPGRLLGRFDLVVEIHTLQALPPRFRPELAEAIASLLNHHGILFISSRVRPESVSLDSLEEAPFPFTPVEMQELCGQAGLEVADDAGGFLDNEDENQPPVRRIRAAFRRRT